MNAPAVVVAITFLAGAAAAQTLEPPAKRPAPRPEVAAMLRAMARCETRLAEQYGGVYVARSGDLPKVADGRIDWTFPVGLADSFHAGAVGSMRCTGAMEGEIAMTVQVAKIAR